MKKIFNKIKNFSEKEFAWKILSIVSFLESFIFPIPPDILLIPMVLYNKNKTKFFVYITIISSVLGALVGYYIGMYFWNLTYPYFSNLIGNFDEIFSAFKTSFTKYGWIIILIGGFSPFPFKVVTISCGIMNVNVFLFILFAFFSRALRFIFIAFMFYKYGEPIKKILNNYINYISLLFVLIFITIYLMR
tara:strand:- start:849 stop:1418 length:570 start_codon:yes stop_codon:yes gene_type:complete